VLANYDGLQSILDFSPESVARFDKNDFHNSFDMYSWPYKFIAKKDFNALVLGSGTGNQVADLLRAGANHVDAVEIDPNIVQLGKSLHAEKPYQSPKVNVYVMDARTFLKNSRDK